MNQNESNGAAAERAIFTWQERAASDPTRWSKSSPVRFMQAEIDDLRAALKAQPAPTEAQADVSQILDPFGAFAKFKSWADDNLGQGYSLAMEDHTFIDPVTRWAFAGYRAGLRAVQGEDSARLDYLDAWVTRNKEDGWDEFHFFFNSATSARQQIDADRAVPQPQEQS